jgi:hypothetical protein
MSQRCGIELKGEGKFGEGGRDVGGGGRNMRGGKNVVRGRVEKGEEEIWGGGGDIWKMGVGKIYKGGGVDGWGAMEGDGGAMEVKFRRRMTSIVGGTQG